MKKSSWANDMDTNIDFTEENFSVFEKNSVRRQDQYDTKSVQGWDRFSALGVALIS